jgi:hypothetical protein
MPSVAVPVLVERGSVPVATHDCGAAYDDLADFTRGHLDVVGIDDAQVEQR